MKRYVPLTLDTIAVLALAVWLGGLAVCWLALAPATHGAPAEAIPAAQKLFAETLRRFSAIAESCGIVLAAIQWVLRRRYERSRPQFLADGVRMVAMFVALFAAEYGRYVLIPTLTKTQSPGALNAIAGCAVAQAVLLAGYAAVTLWLQSPALAASAPAARRSTGSPAPAVAAQTSPPAAHQKPKPASVRRPRR